VSGETRWVVELAIVGRLRLALLLVVHTGIEVAVGECPQTPFTVIVGRLVR